MNRSIAKMSIGLLVFVIRIQTISSQIDTAISLPKIDIISVKNNRKNLFFTDPFISSSLQNQSAQYNVKSYGLGQLSTISFQGLSSENSTVLWHNIPLNSKMNGVFDLNSLATSQNIRFSANSNLYGSGGNIYIEPLRDSFSTYKVSFSLYSMHLYQAMVDAKWIHKRIRIEGQNQYVFGDNNYYYVNQFLKLGQISHNHISQLNSQWSIKIAMARGELELGTWFQAITKQIPPTMSSEISTQYQQDINSRSYIAYNNKFINITSSFFREINKYNDTQIALYTTNQSYATNHVLKWQIWQKEKSGLMYNQLLSLNWLQSPNYPKSLFLWQHTLDLMFYYQLNDQQLLHLGLKHQESTHNIAFLLPSLQYDFILNKHWSTTSYGDINVRVPTANELYWSPGGNKDLQAETIVQLKQKFKWQSTVSKGTISMLLEPFFNHVYKGIRWTPTTNPLVWAPININNIQNIGLLMESEILYRLRNNIRLRIINSTQYLSSKMNSDKTTIYTPNLKMSQSLWLYFYQWVWDISGTYSSIRYTDLDNTTYLPDYFTVKSQLSYAINSKKLTSNISIGVQNIMNTSYQEITNRAMPLRYYYTTLSLKF